MYMIPFFLMAVISAWVAWRNNPMFSARSTIRFFLAVGLMLAVVIAAMFQAANYSTQHPGPIGFTTIGAAILFGAVAMIWVIMAVSTPKSAPLPASVSVVHVYRKKLSVWLKRYLGTVLVLALLEIVLPQIPQIIIGVIGGIFAFLGLVMLFAGYLSARQMDRWLSAVEANPWVHWQYSAEQWKQWIEVEVSRTPIALTFVWKRDWHKIAWLILIIGIAVGIFSPGSPLGKALYVAAVAAILLLFAFLGQKSDKQAPQRVRSLLVNAPPEVYFGQEGLYCDGMFTPWLSSGVYLLRASLDERAPRSLVLHFQKIVVGTTGNQPATADFSVPLPNTHNVSNDLARLQQELSAKCPTATVEIA
jgi:hypothetical protein